MTKNIFETPFGSHLYGTNTAASDHDVKAVFIPDGRDILLGRYKKSINISSKVDINAKNTYTDIDMESYSLDKYLYLVAEGQTVALDMLFSRCGDESKLWQEIYANRNKLLNRQCSGFIGYCRTQANKYGIKGSRVAAVRKLCNLLQPLAETCPSLKLGDSILESEIGPEEHIQYLDIPQEGGTTIRHVKCCDKLCPYTFTVKEAYKIYKHVLDGYGQRALQAEKDEGIDWKALSHAVRIGEQACELLSTGVITFPRWNAKELKKIKAGERKYRDVAEYIEALLIRVELASKKSELPESSDYQYIDDLICREYKKAIIGESDANTVEA